jgi:hypothetical protein
MIYNGSVKKLLCLNKFSCSYFTGKLLHFLLPIEANDEPSVASKA